MKTPYDDIIHLPHHQSSSRPHMTNEARAAQFAPFAALVGYDDAVQETARLTDQRILLDEDQLYHLDIQLHELCSRLPLHPQVNITYFQPDSYKTGGRYITTTSHVKKIHPFRRLLILEDDTELNLDDIYEIEFTPSIEY